MYSIIILGMLSLSIVSANIVPVRPVPICYENEEYRQCGTPCPVTCQDNGPKVCSDVCIQGCFCQEGYVRRTKGGPCVPLDACQSLPACGSNEEFVTCGTLCPLTCDDSTPRACPEICLETCVCREGYIRRTLGGECIPQNNCVSRNSTKEASLCPRNQIYKECGSRCPATCSQPIRVCDLRCVQGCFCQEGYVLNDETQECVKQEECLL